MNPFLITNNCCCAKQCSSFNANSDPDFIAYIESNPYYKYRFSIPCTYLSQKTVKRKFVYEGSIQAVVTENATPDSYYSRVTNEGRGGGSEMGSDFSDECRCLFPYLNVNSQNSIQIEGAFSGQYTFYLNDGSIFVSPYNTTIFITLELIFLCRQGYIDMYSNWVTTANLTENPDDPYDPPITIPGLNSTGSFTFNMFGQSSTVTLLNNWSPSFAIYPGFQGNYRLDANINLDLADCYE